MSRSFAQGLGVVVHGPAVLARGPGIGVGLRCAFGYPDGMVLSTDLKAVGPAARDVEDVSLRPRSGRGRSRGRVPARPPRPHSVLRFEVLEGGELREVEWLLHSTWSHGRGNPDAGTIEPAVTISMDLWLPFPWIAGPRHPRPGEDGTVTVRAGWPEVGLPTTTTVLTLTDPRYFPRFPEVLA
ncbi:hypothetical protein [Kineococcus sp. SYSU DK002]|uniref:hypothetical protein n=1 Tax=Kineococcus sp. SYSU DK002 TaxID=3383123 RepID=UPI003D7CB11F